MKLFTVIFAMLLTFSALGDIGMIGRSASLDNLGNQKGEEIFWEVVKNGSGGTVSKGGVVILDVTADDGFTVTTSSTAGDVPHCIMAESCSAGAACQCIIRGRIDYADFDVTNGAASAGHLVFLSENNAGYIQAESKASIAASDVPIGVFYDDVSSSTDAEIYVKLR